MTARTKNRFLLSTYDVPVDSIIPSQWFCLCDLTYTQTHAGPTFLHNRFCSYSQTCVCRSNASRLVHFSTACKPDSHCAVQCNVPTFTCISGCCLSGLGQRVTTEHDRSEAADIEAVTTPPRDLLGVSECLMPLSSSTSRDTFLRHLSCIHRSPVFHEASWRGVAATTVVSSVPRYILAYSVAEE